jgi:glycosyltransferase involved in cell wall biosynthesis
LIVLKRNVFDMSASISGALRRVVEARRNWQNRVTVTSGRERSAKPTIYFLTPDFQAPAGGIAVIYRHVDILNRAGIDAFVLHQRRGFRCNWFDNKTAIRYVDDTRVLQGDLLVVAELNANVLTKLSPGISHVVFNQNAHLTWKQGGDVARHVYLGSPDLAGVLTVSRHNTEMLSYAFPGCKIARVHLSIDPQIFRPGSGSRPKRIAYMPRRGHDDALQVLQLLKGARIPVDWEIVALSGLSHEQVADALRQCRIFMAFTRHEGFGLPAAEAMACGCYVVGNHGLGGAEFFKTEFSSTVESGDILGFARAVEQAVSNEQSEPGWCQQRGQNAAEFIRSEYSPEREVSDVVSTYTAMLKVA